MNPDNNRPAGQAGQEMGFDKYVAIALLVGLVAGFIIGHSVGSSKSELGKNATTTESGLISDGDESADKGEMANKPSSSASFTSGNGNIEIEVSDQEEGNNVVISKLELDGTYWVAIRDSYMDNKYPYVLGARRLTSGVYEDISVYANRATVSGKKYDIVFYKDSPSFDYSASMLIVKDDRPVGATFEAK